MERLMNFMTGFSIVLIVLVLASLRRAHIRVEHSVSWLFAGLILLVLSRSPLALTWLANWLGVSYAPLVFLLLAGVVFLLTFFRHSVIVSRLRDDNIALAQRVAILEFHLDALRRRAGSEEAT